MGTSKTRLGWLHTGVSFAGREMGRVECAFQGQAAVMSVPPGCLGTLQRACVGAAAHPGQEFRSNAGAS